MHVLPPDNTSGTVQGVGAALAARLTKGGRALSEDAAPRTSKEDTSLPDTGGHGDADSARPVTLGELRAASKRYTPEVGRARRQAVTDDGCPEEAWDPATRFAGAPPRPARRSPAPAVSESAPSAPAPAQPATTPSRSAAASMGSVVSAALRIR